LLSAATSLPACAGLHQHSPAVVKKDPVRLKLDNVDDMIFTASVVVSGEKVHPIMDTGSFELVLFEHGCAGCSGDHTYFNRAKAGKDFKEMGIEAQQSYGSGTAYSSAVQSGVSLDSLYSGKQQMFWLAHDVYMDTYLDDSFGGVFGLGPPASALAFAVEELKAAEDWVNDLDKDERGQYQDALDSMRQVVKLDRKEKPWLDSARVNIFSICLLPGTGKSGVLVLNDEAPASRSWVPVHGDFWQLDVAKTSIGDTEASACTAIVDSGTSLIGAPSDFLESVEAMVEDLDAKYGCQDLSQWPRFEVVLKGGQSLTLDPSSYVAEFDMYASDEDEIAQAANEKVMKFMPHLDRASQRLRRSNASSTVCAAAMFSMDFALDDSDGCQFLFGLPIFREYYIMHKIKGTGKSGDMAFAKGDKNCELVDQTDMQAARKSAGPLKVDPKKIRIPSLGLNGRRPHLRTGFGGA